MAAGLGFKTFTTGEVLTAADTNGYLMQGVLVFASAAARDAAITSPQEGQCCYLKDTDAVLTYSGSAWVGFDDSNAIQNTIVDAKGDLIGATAADTPARLAVGANGTVLTADSAEATGLKWATLSSGAWTSWTPTYTNFTLGNGTQTAGYRDSGGSVDISIKVVLGSTSSITGNPSFALPFTAHTSMGNLLISAGQFGDNGTDYLYAGIWFIDVNTGRFASMASNTTYVNLNNVSATGPFTWVAGDYFTYFFSYRKA